MLHCHDHDLYSRKEYRDNNIRISQGTKKALVLSKCTEKIYTKLHMQQIFNNCLLYPGSMLIAGNTTLNEIQYQSSRSLYTKIHSIDGKIQRKNVPQARLFFLCASVSPSIN